MRRRITLSLILAAMLAAVLLSQSGSRTDFVLGSSPGNPAAGKIRLWANTTTGLLECLNSAGAACIGAASSVTGLAVTAGRTLTVSNSLTLTGTNDSTIAFGAGGTVTYTIASGTAAMPTGALAAGACATTVTVSAPGVVGTDRITWNPNASTTALTGYAPPAALSIRDFPGTGSVNFDVCNESGSSVTPSALTLNWDVHR